MQEFRSYRTDPRIPALYLVVGSYRWHSIKAVDLYFAAGGQLCILQLLNSRNS